MRWWQFESTQALHFGTLSPDRAKGLGLLRPRKPCRWCGKKEVFSRDTLMRTVTSHISICLGHSQARQQGTRGAKWWQHFPSLTIDPWWKPYNKRQAKERKAHRFILCTLYVPWKPSEIGNSQKQGGLLTVHSVSSAGMWLENKGLFLANRKECQLDQLDPVLPSTSLAFHSPCIGRTPLEWRCYGLL